MYARFKIMWNCNSSFWTRCTQNNDKIVIFWYFRFAEAEIVKQIQEIKNFPLIFWICKNYFLNSKIFMFIIEIYLVRRTCNNKNIVAISFFVFWVCRSEIVKFPSFNFGSWIFPACKKRNCKVSKAEKSLRIELTPK